MSQSRFEELIHRARSGDRSAENELMQKCRSYVTLIARAQIEGWMRTKFDASDLVQQTLLEAHQGIEKFKGETEAEWLGWLRGILNHNTPNVMATLISINPRQAKGMVFPAMI